MVVYNTTYKLFWSFLHSYLPFLYAFGLSRSVSELFRWPTFGDLWPFVSGSTVTPGSKPMVPFERPYSSSYLPPIDIFGLSRSVSELFRWHTFGDLWPIFLGQPWPQGQPKWYHSKGHTNFPIWLPLTLLVYLEAFPSYSAGLRSVTFDLSFLGQPWPRGQNRWCHLKGHTQVPICLPLTFLVYLEAFPSYSADILSVTFDLSFGVNRDPEVNPNGTIRKATPTFLFDFRWHFLRILYRFWDNWHFRLHGKPLFQAQFGGFSGFWNPVPQFVTTLTPKRHVLAPIRVFWAISHANRPPRSSWARARETKKERKKVTPPGDFTPVWGRHRSSDFDQTWQCWWVAQRNHPCIVLSLYLS